MWCSLVVVWVLLPLLAALNSPDGYMEAMNKSKHTLRGTGSAIVNKTYEILNNSKHTLKRSVDKEMEALRNAEYVRKVMGNKLVNITLDLCLRDNYHKDEPGPESSLYKQCSPWRKRSCCTKARTEEIHNVNPYRSNFSHCDGKNLSAECQKHFIQDRCFYECSPNVGPWLVDENQIWRRKEQFFKVPLCASDCQAWFNSCVNDYTCTNNRATKFDGQNGTNTCPVGSTCVTFKEKFGDAKTFCETVWDYYWTYSTDDKFCMRLWFNDTDENPNYKVAFLRARQIFPSSGGCSWTDGRATLVLTASWVVVVQALVKILQCT